jgi:hypothetical protein
MAIHTPAHGHSDNGFVWRHYALPNLSVTGLTLDLSENDVAPVRIEDVVRLPVDLPPGNCFPSLCKLPDFFFFGAPGDRFFVAFHANGDLRHSGEDLGFVVLVTGVTGQTLFDMLLVVKVDRLSGFQSRGETDEEEEKKETDCQSEEKEFHSLGLLVLTAKSVYRERHLILT